MLKAACLIGQERIKKQHRASHSSPLNPSPPPPQYPLRLPMFTTIKILLVLFLALLTFAPAESYSLVPCCPLIDTVDAWYNDKAATEALYGPVSEWDTRLVTDSSRAFQNRADFNEDISNFETGQVTTFYNMFSGASSFNQPIGKWNTGQVTTFDGMFNGASLFNQPIGEWNTEILSSGGCLHWRNQHHGVLPSRA